MVIKRTPAKTGRSGRPPKKTAGTTRSRKTAATKSAVAKSADKPEAEPPSASATLNPPKARRGRRPSTTQPEATLQESALTTPTPSVELGQYKPDSLRYDYTAITNDTDRQFLRRAAGEIKESFKQTLLSVIKIGRYLLEAKERIAYSFFIEWVETEFGQFFSYDSAGNYMNIAKVSEDYSVEQLEKLPLNALYVISRSGTPTEIRDQIIQIGQTQRVTREDAATIVQEFRQFRMTEAGLKAPVQQVLQMSPLAEQQETLERLAKLPERRQVDVAKLLASTPDMSFRQALASVSQKKQPQAPPLTSAPGSASDAVIQVSATPVLEQVQAPTLVETYKGDWVDTVRNLPFESVDVCFVEVPMTRSALPTYSELAEYLYPVMKPGGILLATAGQHNIQFIGPLLDPFQVGWTLMLRRRPGNSPRVVGRISFASSYVPLSLSYKSPCRRLDGLVDDLRLEKPLPPTDSELTNASTQAQQAAAADFYFQAPGTLPELEPEPTSIEGSIVYYLQRVLQATDVFMHLVVDQAFSFNLQELTTQTVQKAQASKVLNLIGNG